MLLYRQVVLKAIIPIIEELKKMGYGTGGVFTSFHVDPRNPHVVQYEIGVVDKVNKNHELSVEQALRILLNGDASSYSTRDPERERYGGAIRVGNRILSFRGMRTEVADEAAVIVLGLKINLHTVKQARSMIEKNVLASGLAERFGFEL